jgi:predicted nuclease of predicted toxin-antitoxin system
LKFLVDVNLPPRLISGMRAEGHDCDHVSILLSPQALDTEIAAAANERAAVLMSKDIDFVDLVQRGVLRVALVHVRLGNMSAHATCSVLWSRLPQIVDSVQAGQRIVEIR